MAPRGYKNKFLSSCVERSITNKNNNQNKIVNMKKSLFMVALAVGTLALVAVPARRIWKIAVHRIIS